MTFIIEVDIRDRRAPIIESYSDISGMVVIRTSGTI